MLDCRFPSDCKAIIDITKAPYFADNTGVEDVTDILRKVIDDIFSEYERNFERTREKLINDPDPNALISFEIRKINGIPNVVFAEEQPKAKIIYLPNGIYKVSDTISYFKEEYRNILNGVRCNEMNCNLHICGQSKENTIIRLVDNAKGFEYGSNRPILSFMQGEMSNIAMMNTLENITVDAGSGNPGAIGVLYFANNTGAVRNIKIMSSDSNGRGHIGYAILHDKVSASYTKNLEVIGFDYGIKVECQTQYTVFEHIRCTGQRRCGFWCGNAVVALRDFYSDNYISALKIVGVTAFINVINATFVGGNPIEFAVKKMAGECYLRDITCSGYKGVMRGMPSLQYYVTNGPIQLWQDDNAKDFALVAEETPDTVWEAPEKWASVNQFGAIGDGITDDTQAIREAFCSGAYEINVSMRLTNATLIQGILSGNSPDCALQLARSEPVNLALRGAVYDLSNFTDYKAVMERFPETSGTAYEYQGGNYALPDTETFYMMFCRTDVLNELGISIPKTWREFEEASAVIQRNNFQVNIGGGVANTGTNMQMFATMLLQNGGSFYSDDLKGTNLSDRISLETFSKLCAYYTDYKVPVTADFYNRFRTGLMPLGIQPYTMYMTLSVAAPEIKDKWVMAPIPGVENKDGSINNVQASGGTGCVILQNSDCKQEAWEFLKWWTSADTQFSYSENVEAIIGTAGRVATSNTEALERMSWQGSNYEMLERQMANLKDLPELPGGYYMSRVIDQAFYNTVSNGQNAQDMLLKWSKIADKEIERKRRQYGLV